MKIFYFCFLLLITLCCSRENEKRTAESTEETFKAPENPFADKGQEPDPDTLKKVKKAEKPGIKAAEIKLEKREIKLDSIAAGKVFKTEIYFTNRGEHPLVISSVKSSRKADLSWSKLLIAGSEKSSIGYKINAPDKKGNFTDTIYIVSNAEEQKVLIKAQVR